AAVAARHAFWAPGGPGGVKHQASRGLADRGGTGDRMRIAQSCEWRTLAFAVCGNDHTSRVDLQRRGSLGGRRARGAVERDGRGFGVLEAIPDLACGRAPAHRREDDAEQMACPVQRHPTVALDERLLTRLAHHRGGKCAAEIHGHDPLPMAAAASSTAATIDAYPVHRQMWPENISRTCCSSGAGVSRRKCVTEHKMPAAPKPPLPASCFPTP